MASNCNKWEQFNGANHGTRKADFESPKSRYKQYIDACNDSHMNGRHWKEQKACENERISKIEKTKEQRNNFINVP